MPQIPQSALQATAPVVETDSGVMTPQMTQFLLSLFKRTGGQPGGPFPLPDGQDPSQPSSGGYLYCKAGALYFMGSSGTITKVANA